MLRVILDTNIYGMIIEDGIQRAFKEKTEALKGDLIIYGIGIVRNELRSTAKSRRWNGHNLRMALLDLYDSMTKDHIISLSPLAKSIASLYFGAYKSSGGACSWDEVRNDFMLVAQATLSRLDIVVSEDNRTLASKHAKNAYSRVNKENNMLTPGIIRYEEFKDRII
ncbi:MAG: hypothetical protein FJY76_02255 [Candidatus Aenigmarchaeota archaeon]|nr:hypothetical protein [Candidatus Aenigmarchaeota archaeon]